MSYQPEERYWTDYLRIALPVVGLLLMLGLFWYWASNVIGDSGNSNRPSPTAAVAIINAQTTTPTTQPTVDISAQPNVTATTAGNPGVATETTGTTGNSTSGNSANSGNSSANSGNASNAANSSGNGSNPSKFNVDDTVQTNTDSVRMRDDHSTSGAVVETLSTGSQLIVTGPGIKDGDYIWVPVTDATDSSVKGYVAEDFLEAVP